jgi:hypothetical protein
VHVCAGIGAAIDHHWHDMVPFAQAKIEDTKPLFFPTETLTRTEATTPPTPEKGIEVSGDRACDVRLSELGLPVSEYRSFFDKCMGSAAPSD